MLPLRLLIENFYCHSKSEIDFTQFSSAIIVGKINGNEKLSNGAGKSTIFAAIKYALFNEVETSSLDKVIKHDAEFCRVLYEFQSSLDQQVYRIVRYRGKKPGTDVRIFRARGEEWEDLTQRTATETEREILKLIKINYRTFSNSVLFSQGDLAGLASMTPRERKTALKEALQLGAYSKYESAIKKKTAELEKEIEKHRTILTTLGNPLESLRNSEANLKVIQPKIATAKEALANLEVKLTQTNEQIFTQQQLLDDTNRKSNDLQDNHFRVRQDCGALEEEVSTLLFKVATYEKDQIQVSKQIETHQNRLAELNTLKISIRKDQDIQNEIGQVNTQLADYHAEFKILQQRSQKLSVPLSEDTVCEHCRQTISPEARETCRREIDREKREVDQQVTKIRAQVPKLQKQEDQLKEEATRREDWLKSLTKFQELLERDTEKLQQIKRLLDEFQGLRSKKVDQLTEKKTQLQQLTKESKLQINNQVVQDLQTKIRELTVTYNRLLDERRHQGQKLNLFSKEEAIISYKIKEARENQLKLTELKAKIVECEHQFVIHQKVLTAFGSNGIPALITHTILDDYQLEANTLLAQLRPGLQLQFAIEKDKSNGELADTLEINYLLHNNQLEFSQLSGAQKLIVSLALKLGLASIISKRLGVELKLLLIDEADAALDQYALEAFEQAIKELQKDYKVLVITHNQALREKFNYAIVVEQDSHLNSVAKVMDGGW